MNAVSIDFSDPAVQADPYPLYAHLRAESPVVWNEVTQSWLVSRYDDIVQLFNDPRMSSARTEAIFRVLPPEAQAEMEPLRRVLGSRMLLTDPPEHTRLKNLVMKAFSASATRVSCNFMTRSTVRPIVRQTNSLKSVATWSLRLRPVCSLPAASPISAANSASILR